MDTVPRVEAERLSKLAKRMRDERDAALREVERLKVEISLVRLQTQGCKSPSDRNLQAIIDKAIRR